jgi:hypothetical protein
MPLDEVARRYADRLFQKSQEEIIKRQRVRTSEVIADFTKRNMMQSGIHLKARADLLVEQIGLLGQARADSLLKAYEKSGLPFDDAALGEITTETNQFCHAQQHNAVAAISPLIGQTFNSLLPPNLRDAIVNGIVSGVDGIMARLSRDLAIKRDEVILGDKVHKAHAAGRGKSWDVFISHASEDKDFVGPLADALRKSGLSVWYDEFTLKIGDSLRRKIDEGLAQSVYGIVVLSHQFFAKNWPQKELDGLVSKEIAGTKVILPVWHEITSEEVGKYSPTLSGLLAVNSNEGVEVVVWKLREAMGLPVADYRILSDGTSVVMTSGRAARRGKGTSPGPRPGSRIVFRARTETAEFVKVGEAEGFKFDGKDFIADVL